MKCTTRLHKSPPPLKLKTTSKPTTELRLSVLQHPHLPQPHRSCCCGPVQLHCLSPPPLQNKTPYTQIDQTALLQLIHIFVAVDIEGTIRWRNRRHGADILRSEQPSSMQVMVTCALLTLVGLRVSAVSEADSCPAVCECSEWRTRTISCFDIDILPRFPASTEIL